MVRIDAGSGGSEIEDQPDVDTDEVTDTTDVPEGVRRAVEQTPEPATESTPNVAPPSEPDPEPAQRGQRGGRTVPEDTEPAETAEPPEQKPEDTPRQRAVEQTPEPAKEPASESDAGAETSVADRTAEIQDTTPDPAEPTTPEPTPEDTPRQRAVEQTPEPAETEPTGPTEADTPRQRAVEQTPDVAPETETTEFTPEQGIEESGATEEVERQAQEFESQIVKENPNVDPEDVAVSLVGTEEGTRLVARFTTGAEERIQAQAIEEGFSVGGAVPQLFDAREEARTEAREAAEVEFSQQMDVAVAEGTRNLAGVRRQVTDARPADDRQEGMSDGTADLTAAELREFQGSGTMAAADGVPSGTDADRTPGPAGAAERLDADAPGLFAALTGAVEFATRRNGPGGLGGVTVEELAGVGDEPLEGLITEAEEGVTPSAAAGANLEALAAREKREEVFAERAESFSEKLGRGELPTKEELGAAVFQAGEVTERAFGRFGESIEETLPFEDVGPEVGGGGATVGEQTEGAVRTVFADVPGTLLGRSIQFPTTAAADLTGDATVEQREVGVPGELATPGQVEQGTPLEEIKRQIAEMNPGVTADLITVEREGDGFDVRADIDAEVQRQRIAAREGVEPEDVTLTGDAEQAIITQVTTDGQTPTELGGGFTNIFSQAAIQTGEQAVQRPVEAALLFAPPAVSTARGFGGGVARGTGPLGRAAGQVPRPTIQRFQLGEARGVTVGARRTTGKVEDVQPLVTVGRGFDRPVQTGTPDVPFSRAFGREGRLSPEMTAAETQAFLKSLRQEARRNRDTLAEAEATRVESFREAQKLTQQARLKPNELEPVFREVLEAQEVPGGAARDIVRIAREEGGVIKGSTVQRAAAREVGQEGVARTPRDIDIAEVQSKSRFAERVTEAINRQAGEEVVTLEGGTPTSRATGEKLFDIFEQGADPQSAPGSSMFGRDRSPFGVRNEPNVRTSEGLSTITLSEQTGRKGFGSMHVLSRDPRQVGEVFSRITPEHAGRTKDIPDFFVGEQANIEALRLLGRERAAQRAETQVNRFIETFGEPIQLRARREFQQVRAGDRESPGATLADFSAEARAPPSSRLATGPPGTAASTSALLSRIEDTPSLLDSPGGRPSTLPSAASRPAGEPTSPSPATTSPDVSPSPFGDVESSDLGTGSPFDSPAASSEFESASAPSPSPGSDLASPGPSPGQSPSPGPSPEPSPAPSPGPSPAPSTPPSIGTPSVPSLISTPDISTPSVPSTPSTPDSPLVPRSPFTPTGVPGPDFPPPFGGYTPDRDERSPAQADISDLGVGFNPFATGAQAAFLAFGPGFIGPQNAATAEALADEGTDFDELREELASAPFGTQETFPFPADFQAALDASAAEPPEIRGDPAALEGTDFEELARELQEQDEGGLF